MDNEERRTCRKCQQELPLSAYRPSRVRKKDWMCRLCHRLETKDYQRSEKGLARRLRSNHGLSLEESIHWARVLMDKDTRCAICGLPTSVLRQHQDRGPWFWWILGQREAGWRLELDHIVPADKTGGFRPLCHGCNHHRGALVHTDEECLREATYQWQQVRFKRFLWWLNTTPGQGGRLHRSEHCAKKDAQLAEMRREHEQG